MKRNRIQVLIVDDNASQGQALLEAFTRAGYQAHWCDTSVKAVTAAQRQEFHCLIVDCMLPRMNGIDLVEEIKQFSVVPPKVFLYSGIFKEKLFIKEAMERTRAEAFLGKPFNLNDLLQLVDEAFEDESMDEAPLTQLYGASPLHDDSLVKLIQRETTIHSVHLPMLYKRMVNTGLSGELTLTTGIGDINAIGFHKGRVFSVRTPDKDTYFGGLAIGFGFVSSGEVNRALKTPSNKLLGQKLIDSLSLSPHAIQLVMEEQLALRLSQTLQSGVVSLEWEPKPITDPEYTLHPARFASLLSDWTRSKIDPLWIKTQFAMWGAYTLEGHFHTRIVDAVTIDDLFGHPDFSDRTDLPYFFRQLLLGEAVLGPRADGEGPRNFDFLEKRLTQLLEEYQGLNHFQILGVAEKAQSLELKKAFMDLQEHFDPARLPAGAPPSVMVKCTKVFERIETAYSILADDSARNRYVLDLQNRRAQEILENEPVFRAAIIELQTGHAKEAAKRFQTLLDRKVPFKDLRSYRIWAGLKADRKYTAMTLDQVPPEERHSAPYLMAKGVFHKLRGQYSKAIECFRTAHVLDPRMAIARTELEKLKTHLEKKGHRDLIREVTSVMESLFGKIRRGA